MPKTILHCRGSSYHTEPQGSLPKTTAASSSHKYLKSLSSLAWEADLRPVLQSPHLAALLTFLPLLQAAVFQHLTAVRT